MQLDEFQKLSADEKLNEIFKILRPPKKSAGFTDEDLNSFDIFRKIFPGKKRGLETEFNNFRKKHSDWKEQLPNLLPGLEKEIEHRKKCATAEAFCPEWKHLQSWINQRWWESEYPKVEVGIKQFL